MRCWVRSVLWRRKETPQRLPILPESLTKLNADHIEELEAKLAKVVEALALLHDNVVHAWPCLADLGPLANARTTLAELTGGKDE